MDTTLLIITGFFVAIIGYSVIEKLLNHLAYFRSLKTNLKCCYADRKKLEEVISKFVVAFYKLNNDYYPNQKEITYYKILNEENPRLREFKIKRQFQSIANDIISSMQLLLEKTENQSMIIETLKADLEKAINENTKEDIILKLEAESARLSEKLKNKNSHNKRLKTSLKNIEQEFNELLNKKETLKNILDLTSNYKYTIFGK